MKPPVTHIFCKVIDNFGDIGVCWRLARQLAAEHQAQVTLLVDDLISFSRLAPEIDPQSAEQTLGPLTVLHWHDSCALPPAADLVIEGFACHLPGAYLGSMAARASAPVWLNLEYLSAEHWVEDCHAMESVQPTTGLRQQFWFPGFNARTGGLLREHDLIHRRDDWQNSPAAQADFWSRLGVRDAAQFGQRISLFAYQQPALPGLLEALAGQQNQAVESRSALVLIPEGNVLADVARWFGVETLRAGERLCRGALTVHILPLLTHEDYDRLLWSCDWNGVRGEDSFVRAQWAGKPFLWHIYPQEEEAHWLKLNAFIDQTSAATDDIGAAMNAAWGRALCAWNRENAGTYDWQEWLQSQSKIADCARNWCAQQLKQADLALGLMRFYANRVESPPTEMRSGLDTA